MAFLFDKDLKPRFGEYQDFKSSYPDNYRKAVRTVSETIKIAQHSKTALCYFLLKTFLSGVFQRLLRF